MRGHHLSLEEREILAQGRAAGHSQAAIADRLGCAPSTISRELKRNGGAFGLYLPSRAQALAERRRRRSKQPWKLEGTDLGRRVQEGLRQYWSPEQIAGRLRFEEADHPDRWVSHQCIYEWIARERASGGTWHRCLRRRGRRRRRSGTPEKRGRIVGRVGIEHRPPEVAARVRLGDWESDTLLGSRSRACLATHAERFSRYTVLAKLPDRTAERFNAGTVSAFARHGEDLPRETLTADNGKEFARFAVLQTALGLDVYFARPYHAWQRATVENANGLLRQFFPKGMDLGPVTPAHVQRVESLLNHRPRKCLGYRTPHEVLRE
jgi:IS30 family transposase